MKLIVCGMCLKRAGASGFCSPQCEQKYRAIDSITREPAQPEMPAINHRGTRRLVSPFGGGIEAQITLKEADR